MLNLTNCDMRGGAIAMNNSEIKKALNELLPTFGVRCSVNQSKLLQLIESKKLDEAIKEIAVSMGLPIKIIISFVTEENNDGAPARVLIPLKIPKYGSSELVNFPIHIQICNVSIKTPTSLLTVLAHEISHVVLYSNQHIGKDDEYYTDLTAMLMGYARIMKSGRKAVKSTSTNTRNEIISYTETIEYGYLSDNNFNYALKMIESYVKQIKHSESVLLRKVSMLSKRLSKADDLIKIINNYLSYLAINQNQRIQSNDAQKIVTYHSPSFFDSLVSTLENGRRLVENIIVYVDSDKTYSARDVDLIQRYNGLFEEANMQLSVQTKLFEDSLKVLRKYVSISSRLKYHYSRR